MAQVLVVIVPGRVRNLTVKKGQLGHIQIRPTATHYGTGPRQCIGDRVAVIGERTIEIKKECFQHRLGPAEGNEEGKCDESSSDPLTIKDRSKRHLRLYAEALFNLLDALLKVVSGRPERLP